MPEIICVVCEIPLETEEEIEMELCNACAGNADSCNYNKNKEELDDLASDLPVSVDRILARQKPLNFSDFPLDIPDEEEDESSLD